MRKRARILAACLLVAVGAVSQCAHAANLKVNCEKKETINKALRHLATSNPQGPNTISVEGSCKENIVIQSLDRLTLITKTGASISDQSNGTLSVVDIEDSRTATIQGFTINGGDTGIRCGGVSVCYLQSNIVQSAVGQQGVVVGGGGASQAFLTGNTIENNAQRGLTVNLGASVVSDSDNYHDNTGPAIVANTQALFTAVNSTIQNNGGDGSAAIVATGHSTVRLISCTVSGNQGDGVRVQQASEAQFNGPDAVTANAGVGVSVGDLSFAFFDAGGNNVTGNLGGIDVVCSPQFSATRGALTNIGGGVTNCTEP